MRSLYIAYSLNNHAYLVKILAPESREKEGQEAGEISN
jgi:uncharacterized protein YchJ